MDVTFLETQSCYAKTYIQGENDNIQECNSWLDREPGPSLSNSQLESMSVPFEPNHVVPELDSLSPTSSPNASKRSHSQLEHVTSDHDQLAGESELRVYSRRKRLQEEQEHFTRPEQIQEFDPRPESPGNPLHEIQVNDIPSNDLDIPIALRKSVRSCI